MAVNPLDRYFSQEVHMTLFDIFIKDFSKAVLNLLLCKVRIFYWLIYKPSYCNFLESRKKIISKKEIFYAQTLNIIGFVEKKNIFEVLSVVLRVTLLKVFILSRFLAK